MTDTKAEAAAIAKRGAALRNCTETNRALVAAYNARDDAIRTALMAGATIPDIAAAAMLPAGTIATIAHDGDPL